MKVVTVPGRLVFEDRVPRTLTVEAAIELVKDLLDAIPAVKVPEMIYTEDDALGRLTCPHCRTTYADGEDPVVEATFTHLAFSLAPLDDDGGRYIRGLSENLDTHTLSWLCATCMKAVAIPAAVQITY